MMTNERWLRSSNSSTRALALTSQDRSAFLSDASPDDAALRQEVESLVESSLRAGSFLENPVRIDGSARRGDLEGRRIGPYKWAHA